MAQAQSCQEPQTVTTEGLEDLFQGGTAPEPARNQGGTTPEPGLTLKEAVELYKISEKSIRIKISQGRIPAVKVPGNNGPEWRIFPNGLPSPEPDRNQPGTRPEGDEPEEVTTVEPGWFSSEIEAVEVANSSPPEQPRELDKMLDVIRQQAEKLEAANFRIGYLEAQTEGYRNQIKLLTDSQHKRNWWAEFLRWFVGSKDTGPSN